MKVLVTGATGKVGQAFVHRFLDDPNRSDASVRALCHNRTLDETDRLEVARGSIADRAAVDRALDGVTHVLHLATCKETPDDVMDVAHYSLSMEKNRRGPLGRMPVEFDPKRMRIIDERPAYVRRAEKM